MKNYIIETYEEFINRKRKNEAYYYNEGDFDGLLENRMIRDMDRRQRIQDRINKAEALRLDREKAQAEQNKKKNDQQQEKSDFQKELDKANAELTAEPVGKATPTTDTATNIQHDTSKVVNTKFPQPQTTGIKPVLNLKKNPYLKKDANKGNNIDIKETLRILKLIGRK